MWQKKIIVFLCFILAMIWGCNPNAPSVSPMTNPPTYISNTGSGKDLSAVNRDVVLDENQVRKVQALLRRQGYSQSLSGEITEEMRNAIKAYQRDNDLADTGYLNKNTLDFMGINYKENKDGDSPEYSE